MGSGGGWFVPPAPRSGPPAPERTYYCVTITTSINIILSVLVGVLVLHVNNVSYVCVTYVWFRFGSRHFRLLYMFMSAHTRVRNIAIGSAQGAIVQNMFGGSSLFTFPCFLGAWSFKNIWTNIGTFGYRLKSAVQFVSYLLGGRVGLDEALCGLHFLLDPTHIPAWTRAG